MWQPLVILMVDLSMNILTTGISAKISFNYLLSQSQKHNLSLVYYLSYVISIIMLNFFNRMFVLSWFPYLVHLDDRLVTEEQRLEAKRLYKRPMLENIFTLPDRVKDIHFRMAFSKLLTFDGQKKPRETNSII